MDNNSQLPPQQGTSQTQQQQPPQKPPQQAQQQQAAQKDSSQKSSPQTSDKPKKGKNTVLIIIIVIVVLLLLCACSLGAMFYFGVGLFSEKVAENVIEGSLESAMEEGGNVDVDFEEDSFQIESEDGSIYIGSASEWPSTISDKVPEFTGGTLISVMESSDESGSYWTIGYEDATSSSTSDYASELQNEGWTKTTSGEYGGVSMEEWTYENLSVIFSYNPENNDFTIAVGEEL